MEKKNDGMMLFSVVGGTAGVRGNTVVFCTYCEVEFIYTTSSSRLLCIQVSLQWEVLFTLLFLLGGPSKRYTVSLILVIYPEMLKLDCLSMSIKKTLGYWYFQHIVSNICNIHEIPL